MTNKQKTLVTLSLEIDENENSNSLSSVPNFLEVIMYYSLGGMNYFTYKKEGRGIYVSVTPVKVGGGFRTYTSFTGIKCNVKPLKRFSQKALNEAMPSRELLINMVNEVLSKNNISLTQQANEHYRALISELLLSESQAA